MRINLICNNSQYSASDLEVESTATVAELRRRIQTRTGLSRAAADSARLLHTGRLLSDSNTLDHSNVHDGSTIHMVLAPANQSTSANTGSSSASSSMPFGSSTGGTSSTTGGFTGPGGVNGPQMTFSFGGGSGTGPAPPFPFPPGFMPPGANSGEMVINFMDGDPNIDVQSIMNSIGNMISTQLPGVVPGGVNVGVTSNVNGTPFSQSWTTTSSGSTSPASTTATTTPTTTPPTTTATTASSTTNAPASHTTTPPPAPAPAPVPTPATSTNTNTTNSPQPHITAHIRTHAVPSSGPFNFMSSVLPTSGTNASTSTNTVGVPTNANANVGVSISNLSPFTHMPMMENTHTSAALPSEALHNVHVHVHCTMDELEVLPERIARLSQRMQPSRPSVFPHMMAIPRPNAPGGGHATSNQQQQQSQNQQSQNQQSQNQQQEQSSSSSLELFNSLFESISSQMPQILSLSVSVGTDLIMSSPMIKESIIRAYKYVKEIIDKHETCEYMWTILSQREHHMEFFNAVHSFCQNNLTSEQMTRLKPKMTRLMCHFVGQVGEIVLQQEQNRGSSTNGSNTMTTEEENVIVDKMKPIVKKFVACAMLLIKNEQPRIVELIKEFFTQQAQSTSASTGALNTSSLDRIWSAVGTLVSQDELEQLLSHPYNGSALSRLDRFMSCDRATNESTSLSETTDELPEEDHISSISSGHHISHTQAEQNNNNNNDDDDLLDSLANELLEQEDQSSNIQSSAQNSSLYSSELKDALEEWSSAVNASEATRLYISRLLDISL